MFGWQARPCTNLHGMYRWFGVVPLKDRLGDQRGGSEWEPIKILLKNLAYAPKSLPKNLAHTCEDHVVTTDLPTLGTS
jgi:hypothetical protein